MTQNEFFEKVLNNEANVRPISTIAMEIKHDWKNWRNSYAQPYLEAMMSLTLISDSYGWDSAYSIVAYFLSNAASWKGETARRIKKELKDLMKSYDKGEYNFDE